MNPRLDFQNASTIEHRSIRNMVDDSKDTISDLNTQIYL